MGAAHEIHDVADYGAEKTAPAKSKKLVVIAPFWNFQLIHVDLLTVRISYYPPIG
jgi:hypothetical protein